MSGLRNFKALKSEKSEKKMLKRKYVKIYYLTIFLCGLAENLRGGALLSKISNFESLLFLIRLDGFVFLIRRISATKFITLMSLIYLLINFINVKLIYF
jgi:hypothetical protein